MPGIRRCDGRHAAEYRAYARPPRLQDVAHVSRLPHSSPTASYLVADRVPKEMNLLSLPHSDVHH
jgi:hypothetical protein